MDVWSMDRKTLWGIGIDEKTRDRDRERKEDLGILDFIFPPLYPYLLQRCKVVSIIALER